MNRSKKFMKFIKKEETGGGGGSGVVRGASTGASSTSDLGKIPSPAMGVVSEPGVSYSLPKRKKKKDRY